MFAEGFVGVGRRFFVGGSRLGGATAEGFVGDEGQDRPSWAWEDGPSWETGLLQGQGRAISAAAGAKVLSVDTFSVLQATRVLRTAGAISPVALARALCASGSLICARRVDLPASVL